MKFAIFTLLVLALAYLHPSVAGEYIPCLLTVNQCNIYFSFLNIAIMTFKNHIIHIWQYLNLQSMLHKCM